MAMGAAALNDAAAWCLLVLAISLGQIAAHSSIPSISPALCRRVLIIYRHPVPQPIQQIWALLAMCS